MIDFVDVKGQEHVKRAIEVAAAGGHNLIMIGPPGSGKTMIAKRIPTILPDMTLDEALETTKIHSIMGLLADDVPLIATRPLPFTPSHHLGCRVDWWREVSAPRRGQPLAQRRAVS